MDHRRRIKYDQPDAGAVGRLMGDDAGGGNERGSDSAVNQAHDEGSTAVMKGGGG